MLSLPCLWVRFPVVFPVDVSLILEMSVIQLIKIDSLKFSRTLLNLSTVLVLPLDISLQQTLPYRGAGKSLARPTSRCILFHGKNISFDASLVININSTDIPPIMIISRCVNIKIFCRCSLFPSWSG